MIGAFANAGYSFVFIGEKHLFMKLLIAGATGLVGRHVLEKALHDERVRAVIAPGRQAAGIHPKLFSPVVDFDNLLVGESGWQVDAVICTLGTTMKKAGSKEAFYRVDHDYPLAVARLARKHGTSSFVLTSAAGADVSSRFFYYRVKGEVERELASMGFESLTFVRPGLIGGRRDEPRPLETSLGLVKKILHPLLPKSWRINPAEKIADRLLKAALASKAGTHVVTSEEMASTARVRFT